MKKTLTGVVAAMCLMLMNTGCYSTLSGHVKPGVPFGKDTIINRYERPWQRVFAAAKEVLSFNGTLASENTIDHTLTARIDTRTVWVRVEQAEPNITQVSVQARNGWGTDIDLASEIATQIALRLR